MLNRTEILESITKLYQLESLDDIYEHTKLFFDSLEFKHFNYSLVPNYYSPTHATSPPVTLNTYDTSWMEYYNDKRYDKYDLSVQHCLKGAPEPYIWNRSFNLKDLPKRNRMVFQEARVAGVTQGVSLPLLKHAGAIGAGAVSFEGSDSQIDPFLATRIDIVGQYFYALNEVVVSRFSDIFGSNHSPELTEREYDVLRWMSHGCTYEEISQKLTIGISTVRKHISSIFIKLGAKNSNHAIATAVRWNLV